MRCAIGIEQAGDNYSAYVPDLPGCIASGETVGEIRDAIRFHLDGLHAIGVAIPPPTSIAQHVET